jgi:copper chaperone CopZ
MYRILIIAILFFVASCQQANNKEKETVVAKPEIVEVKFQVEGMSCTECEQSIAKGVNELAGIETVKASYVDSITVVKYDKSKTNEAEIAKMIEKRGYKVKGKI